MKKFYLALVLAAYAIALAPGISLAERSISKRSPRYSVTDIGGFGGQWTFPLDMNQKGDVVGWAQGSDRTARGFLFRDGELIDYDSEFPGSRYVVGISDKGDLIRERIALGSSRRLLYITRPQYEVQVPVPSACQQFNIFRINNSGTAVGFGYCTIDSQGTKRFTGLMARKLTVTLFHPLGMEGAQDISNSGLIAGYSYYLPDGTAPAMILNPNTGDTTLIPLLPRHREAFGRRSMEKDMSPVIPVLPPTKREHFSFETEKPSDSSRPTGFLIHKRSA